MIISCLCNIMVSKLTLIKNSLILKFSFYTYSYLCICSYVCIFKFFAILSYVKFVFVYCHSQETKQFCHQMDSYCCPFVLAPTFPLTPPHSSMYTFSENHFSWPLNNTIFNYSGLLYTDFLNGKDHSTAWSTVDWIYGWGTIGTEEP